MHEAPSVTRPDRITHGGLVRLLADAAREKVVPTYVPSFGGRPAPAEWPTAAIGDVEGRSVLDIGCNLGHRCFEAVRLGARQVVGIDCNPVRIAQAEALAERLGAPVRFIHMDADRELPTGGFDIVLCPNVLQRSRDPLSLLRRLARITRDVLVLEFPDVGSSAAGAFLRELRRRGRTARRIDDLPVVLVGRDGPSLFVEEERFYFTRSSLRHLLVNHLAAFARVDFAASQKGSCLAVARRRRIGHLLVVAGAGGSGKSTLIRGLAEATLPAALRDRLGPVAPGSWREVAPVDHTELNESEIANLVLHYDFSRVYYRNLSFERDEAFRLLDDAQQVTCITVWCDPAQLLARAAARLAEIDAAGLNRRRESVARRAWRRVWPPARLVAERQARRATNLRWTLDLYRDPHAVAALYRSWLAFCDRRIAGPHWVADMTDGPAVLREREGWEPPPTPATPTAIEGSGVA